MCNHTGDPNHREAPVVQLLVLHDPVLVGVPRLQAEGVEAEVPGLVVGPALPFYFFARRGLNPHATENKIE